MHRTDGTVVRPPQVTGEWKKKIKKSEALEVSAISHGMVLQGKIVGGPPRQDQLQTTQPLFGVGFSVEGMTVRVDVLRPAPSSGWAVTEVKSSTMTSLSSKKAEQDVALQVHVLEKAGVPLGGAR